MTSAQFAAYLRSAGERIVDQARNEFDAAVEATRIGTAAAWSKRAAASWNRARNRPRSQVRRRRGLTGVGLERAVTGIASRDPSLVGTMDAAAYQAAREARARERGPQALGALLGSAG